MTNVLNDEYFMRQALVEARIAADEGEVPVGAVIVCNNQIIARAHNQTERLHDPTAHHGCRRCIGCEISDRMHALCDGRTLCHVCWCARLVTN